MRDVGTAKSLELAALSPVIDAIKSEIFKKSLQTLQQGRIMDSFTRANGSNM